MIEIKVANSNNRDTWNKFVEKRSMSTPYHLWEYGEVLSSIYNYRRYYFMVMDGGELFGVLPLLHVNSKLFGNRLISMPFCEYGGPIFDAREENRKDVQAAHKSLLAEVNELSEKLGVEYVEIRNPSVLSNVWCDTGYAKYNRYLTFRVSLKRSQEELWRNLNKKTRTTIRKVLKSDLEVEKARGAKDIASYYNLYLRTQCRLGSPPHFVSFFENLYRCLTENRMKIDLVRYEGECIAGVITFQLNKEIYWWSNVMNAEYRSLNPTNLLLWNIIEWGVKCNFNFLDLGRTRPATGIHHFKKGWGGKELILQDYIHFLELNTTLPDPSQKKYQYLSKLWSLLPETISKHLGPRIIRGIAL